MEIIGLSADEYDLHVVTWLFGENGFSRCQSENRATLELFAASSIALSVFKSWNLSATMCPLESIASELDFHSGVLDLALRIIDKTSCASAAMTTQIGSTSQGHSIL